MEQVEGIRNARDGLREFRIRGGNDGDRKNRNPVTERSAKDDLRLYLLNKYRALLVDRLTAGDLEELRICQERRSDTRKAGNEREQSEYLHRFVLKLQEYIPDAILIREIAGIETLILLMKPEDLPERQGVVRKTR